MKPRCKCGNGHVPSDDGCRYNCYRCCAGKGGILEESSEDARTISGTNDIYKTRGVPSMGSGNYGARGQRLSFRSFDGENTNGMSMNIGQLVLGYLAVGLTAYVVGYSLMKGKEKAN